VLETRLVFIMAGQYAALVLEGVAERNVRDIME